MMGKNTIRYTSFALGVLSKILGSNFKVHHIEKIPKQPVLFVANHFTRSETFLLPYLIYKYTGRQVRCLADSSLFNGLLGDFLTSVGGVSTSDRNRDKIILDDLVNAKHDWIIYPEGSMIKSKKIDNKKGYINYTPSRVGRARTGSAVLALKSEIYRQDIIKAYKNNNNRVLDSIKRNLKLTYNQNLEKISTAIVPISITYYPLRPGENKIKSFFTKLIKDVPSQMLEELEIEGNLLLRAEINIGFSDPIYIKDYIKNIKSPIDQLPIIGQGFKANLVIKYFKNRLTNKFMSNIYNNIEINFDHIFASILYHLKDRKITTFQLKQIIYLSASMIKKLSQFRFNKSLKQKELIRIFADEECRTFDDVFNLAKNQKIINVDKDSLISVRSNAFTGDEDFHQIRRENSLKVIVNEFLMLSKPNLVIKRVLGFDENDLGKRVFNDILDKDISDYLDDYQLYFDKTFSKDKEVGKPFVLNCDNDSEIAILLVHGYKSAPKEVEEMAYFLSKFNFKIYAVRLKGHGTSPINLKYIKWQDWYKSVQMGYAALSNICKKIIIIGFSTGGLLSLLMSANKSIRDNKIASIISINSALKLRDIRSHFVPGINIWNEFLDKFHIEKGHFSYIDAIPENPHINYSRNYLHGVEELGKLMSMVDDNLHKIKNDILIIQANNDPVVNPKSADTIYKKIKNAKKEIFNIESNRHVIITGKDSKQSFDIIKNYLAKSKMIS